MSLKKAILRAKFLSAEDEFSTVEIPGDPLLFSALYNSEDGIKKIKNCPEKQIIKFVIKKYPRSDVPCVLHLIFYVAPPLWMKLSPKQIRDETTPATYSFELADYFLYVMSLINKTIISSHKQVVKVNMEKFYSTKPRTYMKFLKWSDYVELHREDTVYPKT